MGDTATCVECGRPAGDSLPEGLDGRWLERALEFGVMCSDCSAAEEETRARAEAAGEAHEQDQRVFARRAGCGIPELLRGLDLVDPAHPDALETAARWAAGQTLGLLLTGPVGVGKTYMTAAAAWRRLDIAPLRWFSVPVLFAHLSLDYANPLRETAVASLAGTGALVLDDLDKARPSEYAAEQIFAVIDARVTARAALGVTTNLRLDELAAKWPEPYGTAIVDRLASHCESFYLGGESRRRLEGAG